ncbi:MAG: hypothetical protein ACTS44_00435 [Candidatus Hodgkinia cicadicola]
MGLSVQLLHNRIVSSFAKVGWEIGMKLGTFERKVLRLREGWTAEVVHSNGRRGFYFINDFWRPFEIRKTLTK